jgi:hypothetical protein
MSGLGHSLEKIVEGTNQLRQVLKSDLRLGDLVLVTTRNSTYSLSVLDEECYVVSGGWFDRNGLSPVKTTVTGCSWGGNIIKVDAIAACGLHLEFGNRVITTPIQKVSVVRFSGRN